jgi:hypothetical protein
VSLRSVLASVSLVALSVGAGTAAADTTWTRISTTFDSNIVVPSLALDGSNAVAAWGYRVSANNERVEAVTFRPALNGDAVSLAGPSAAASNWVQVDTAPQLFPRPGGGLQLAWGGFRSVVSTDPFAGALAVAARNADGSFGAPMRAGRPAVSSALLLSDGTPMFASGHAGGALVLRGIDPDQDGVDHQGALGGCCAYVPRLGLDGMGRLWLVWYSNASGNIGLYVRQVNPATGGPVGSPQKAPGSESVYNNSFRIAFACAVVCRVVYGTAATPGRLVSWAPGETQTTPITTAFGTDSAGRVVTAAYRADGRLWVAWFDRGNYYFMLGDARGAGGEALSAGHPPGDPGAFALNSLPVPDGLLLATNWVSGGRLAIWANVVTTPPPATPAPGPRDVEVGYDPKKKRFLINVQYVLRTACRNPCPARAELRMRTGRRLYSVGALPGDGKLVLGRRQGIKIPRGRKIFFYIPIKRSALLKVPFKTIRGYRYGETRLRVWLRTPGGEALTVRDGRIRVSIARIKSGALPNLRGIL